MRVTGTLAQLNVPGSSITLRRAVREDLPGIVGLLGNDPLGRTREAATGDEGATVEARSADPIHESWNMGSNPVIGPHARQHPGRMAIARSARAHQLVQAFHSAAYSPSSSTSSW